MKTRSAKTRIQPATFEGVPALEISTGKARLVLPTGFGPRVGFFGRPGGRNLLFWDEAGRRGRWDWIMRGGHRVWMTRPGADESAETYAADNAPCTVEERGGAVRLIGPEDPELQLRRSITVRPLDAETFSVVSRIENRGEMLWSGGVWGITCTAPGRGTSYGVPLGDGSEWDVFKIVIPKRWAGQTSRVTDPQISFTEGALVLRPRGLMSKRFIEAPQGVIGMTDPGERLSFVKKVEFQRGASYPLGTNIAFFVGPRNYMVEMETMSPEQTLRPGESISSEEIWALRPPIDWRRVTPGQKLV